MVPLESILPYLSAAAHIHLRNNSNAHCCYQHAHIHIMYAHAHTRSSTRQSTYLRAGRMQTHCMQQGGTSTATVHQCRLQ
jgi:hypothetical protein